MRPGKQGVGRLFRLRASDGKNTDEDRSRRSSVTDMSAKAGAHRTSTEDSAEPNRWHVPHHLLRPIKVGRKHHGGDSRSSELHSSQGELSLLKYFTTARHKDGEGGYSTLIPNSSPGPGVHLSDSLPHIRRQTDSTGARRHTTCESTDVQPLLSSPLLAKDDDRGVNNRYQQLFEWHTSIPSSPSWPRMDFRSYNSNQPMQINTSPMVNMENIDSTTNFRQKFSTDGYSGEEDFLKNVPVPPVRPIDLYPAKLSNCHSIDRSETDLLDYSSRTVQKRSATGSPQHSGNTLHTDGLVGSSEEQQASKVQPEGFTKSLISDARTDDISDHSRREQLDSDDLRTTLVSNLIFCV